MSQKNKFLKDMEPMLEEKFGWARTEMILDYTRNFFEELCAQNASQTSAVKAHTVKTIYPCIAVYRGIQRAGISQLEALSFCDWACSRQAEPKAASMRAMCKIPGIPQLMPRIFKFVTVHTFGEKAGFQATFYPTGSNRCKFDMTRCLYCDVCRQNGCPELVPCFCHTDDVTDGNMHPRLLWNRTRIMGDGADCCDFDLILLGKDESPADYQKGAQDTPPEQLPENTDTDKLDSAE